IPAASLRAYRASSAPCVSHTPSAAFSSSTRACSMASREGRPVYCGWRISIVSPPHLVDAAKLIAPHGEHRRWREYLSIEIRSKAEREERTVVENPGRRQLDESRRELVPIGQ